MTPSRERSQAIVNRLDLDGTLNGLPPFLHASVRLGTHDTAAPVADRLLVLLEVALLDGGDELGELALVLRSHLSQSENGGSLEHVNMGFFGTGVDYVPSDGRPCRAWPCP